MKSRFRVYPCKSYLAVSMKLRGPFCGCPHDKSPTIWGLYEGRDFGNSPSAGLHKGGVLQQANWIDGAAEASTWMFFLPLA